ncbi:MAG: ribosomal protein S18-alanine N-acetyltransferase [Actinomycetia bacterium]|nr:ribosomal protein S18-alanine N-acetyltransferase [Actinomycetes bacterium]MCP4963190.1 ribosomal protein S18-alanine N-acetyltransferase [Actinomycetes bacterium]
MIPAADRAIIVVEPMTKRHLKAVRAIDAKVYPRPWSLAMYLQELANGSNRVYRIVRSAGKVVGYGGLMVVGSDGHVTSVATDPDHRSIGVGSRALLALVRGALDSACEALTLEVRVSNIDAQRMYGRFGFERAGVRKGYYTDNREDAVVMWANDIGGSAFRSRMRDIEASFDHHTEWRSS